MLYHMEIKRAKVNQFIAVRAFYDAVIDGISSTGDSVGWKKDSYPTSDFLMDSMQKGELFVAKENGMIIGAMVQNHQASDEYKKVQWSVQAEDSEVTVIHALAVHPSYQGRGNAKQLVQFVIDCARRNRQKAIRIDVLPRNRRAKALYTGIGFQYLHTLPMFYEDVGWTDFELYEYPLE